MATTIVTGCGRCGTTMVMRMLHAGGMPVLADGTVGFEYHKAQWGHANWIGEAEGRAVKILDLHRITPPRGDYRIIVMTRDRLQQSLSMVKMLRTAGINVSYGASKSFEKSIGVDNSRIRKVADRLSQRVLRLRFEGVLVSPRAAAEALAALHDGIPLDVDAMTAVVIRRPSECLPGMLEASLVQQAAP
jgi:hypothetical protein